MRTTISFLHQSGLNWLMWLPAAWTTNPLSGRHFVLLSVTSTASSHQVGFMHFTNPTSPTASIIVTPVWNPKHLHTHFHYRVLRNMSFMDTCYSFFGFMLWIPFQFLLYTISVAGDPIDVNLVLLSLCVPRLWVDRGQWHPSKPDGGLWLDLRVLWESGAGSVWRETPDIPAAAWQGKRKRPDVCWITPFTEKLLPWLLHFFFLHTSASALVLLFVSRWVVMAVCKSTECLMVSACVDWSLHKGGIILYV